MLGIYGFFISFQNNAVKVKIIKHGIIKKMNNSEKSNFSQSEWNTVKETNKSSGKRSIKDSGNCMV